MRKTKAISKAILTILIAVSITLFSFSGCSQSSEKMDFIYPFKGDIASFDPQIASTADEFLIIENCFEGLIRINDNGTVQKGLAESWDISNNGKTYTFKLRQGAKWYIEDDSNVQSLFGEGNNPDITADDFVFALRRAVDKNTNAPLFSLISGIKNASKIHSGKADTSTLGVKAIDDYTLEIKLDNADSSFLNALSTSVAMPCNEQFFNATNGRYGLGLMYSVFNGQFYLSSILDNSYVLKNNKQYTGEFKSKVTDITFNITDENSEITKYLKSGYYDAAYISGAEYEELGSNAITATSYSDKLLAFVLNKNHTLLSQKELRQAVCLSISDIATTDTEHLTRAVCYTPPCCTIGASSAPEAIGSINPKQNTEKAKQLWKKGLEKLGISSADFTVIVPSEYEKLAKELVQGIQGGIGRVSSYGENDKSISFSLKIKALSAQDFNTAFENGEYDLALYKFTTSSQSPLDFLDNIINGGFSGNVPKAKTALKEAHNVSADKLANSISKCEKALLSDYSVKPVLYESSYYVQAKGVSGVQFHPGSGRVCFVNAERK